MNFLHKQIVQSGTISSINIDNNPVLKLRKTGIFVTSTDITVAEHAFINDPVKLQNNNQTLPQGKNKPDHSKLTPISHHFPTARLYIDSPQTFRSWVLDILSGKRRLRVCLRSLLVGIACGKPGSADSDLKALITKTGEKCGLTALVIGGKR